MVKLNGPVRLRQRAIRIIPIPFRYSNMPMAKLTECQTAVIAKGMHFSHTLRWESKANDNENRDYSCSSFEPPEGLPLLLLFNKLFALIPVSQDRASNFRTHGMCIGFVSSAVCECECNHSFFFVLLHFSLDFYISQIKHKNGSTQTQLNSKVFGLAILKRLWQRTHQSDGDEDDDSTQTLHATSTWLNEIVYKAWRVGFS